MEDNNTLGDFSRRFYNSSLAILYNTATEAIDSFGNMAALLNDPEFVDGVMAAAKEPLLVLIEKGRYLSPIIVINYF